MQLADRAIHDVPMCGTRTEEDRARCHPRNPCDQLRALVAHPFTGAGPVRDDDDRGASSARDVV